MKKQILTLVATLLLFSCSKEEATTNDPKLSLPPETQTGANTFGCYINGKLVIPRDGSGTVGGSDKGARFWGGYPDGAYNEIDIRDYKSYRTAQILIHIQDIKQLGAGDYIVGISNGMSSIDGLNHNYIHCRIFDDATNSYQYYRSFNNSGIIHVTRYDLPNRIASGIFNCRVRNSANPSDEIEITQGRFDLKWDILPDKPFP